MSLVADDTILVEKLKGNEMMSPAQVLVSFFESFDPEVAVFQIREVRDIVMKEKFGGCEYSMDKEDMLFFFEKLEQVVEASWLMKE